jgi:hypothetical protein
LWCAIGAALVVTLLAGCVTFEPVGYGSRQASDPPFLSPYQRPLNSPQPQVAPVPQPNELIPTPTYKPPLEAPEEIAPAPDSGVPPADATDEGLFEGPEIVPFGGTAAPVLELDVQAQEQQKLGEPVKFTVTLRNGGAEPIDGLAITVEFDDGLVFPGREEKMFRQVLGSLDKGESRELPLTLVSQSAGRQCATFSVSADDRELASEQVCVEFAP